ncbi:MAG TPA: tagaturonate epimerase family protein [Candidatus Acidoferrales bacterium]|nr:tagaturonate epimerase family protein [Candidatus Acidoferrales bacterium]
MTVHAKTRRTQKIRKTRRNGKTRVTRKAQRKGSIPKLEKELGISVYPNSINEYHGTKVFMAREKKGKFLYAVSDSDDESAFKGFEGEVIRATGGEVMKKCPVNHHNAEALQKICPFTKPVTIGLKNSYGFGDRLGLANPGHLRALKGYKFMPVLAQQSIRELTRTQRTPEEVMDAAVWAAFQEGYKDGFGADADHLKTTDDVDRLMKAGFTMFTIDPSDHVVNGVAEISEPDLLRRVAGLPWSDFGDSYENLLARYESKSTKLRGGYSITSTKRSVLEACLKYMAAIINVKRIHNHLKTKHADHDCEIEVSIDETDTVTTPFEHFFIVNELKRMGVGFVSLAPRFVGDFEKGIEYKGDIELFKEHYLQHAAIAEYFGFYKISFHSGSDKFRIYEAVGAMKQTRIHVKTAGTSYLEALKVVAMKDPKLFREILDYALSLFDTERKSYFVSADMKKIRPGAQYKDNELAGLFDSNDVRQALHVTYGRVLTDRNEKGQYIFRDRIYECLNNNEALHYDLLVKHFDRHLKPFKKWK